MDLMQLERTCREHGLPFVSVVWSSDNRPKPLGREHNTYNVDLALRFISR